MVNKFYCTAHGINSVLQNIVHWVMEAVEQLKRDSSEMKSKFMADHMRISVDMSASQSFVPFLLSRFLFLFVFNDRTVLHMLYIHWGPFVFTSSRFFFALSATLSAFEFIELRNVSITQRPRPSGLHRNFTRLRRRPLRQWKFMMEKEVAIRHSP